MSVTWSSNSNSSSGGTGNGSGSGSGSSDVEAAEGDVRHELRAEITTPALRITQDAMWHNSFGVGTMRGSWDAGAWAAQGLPADGELSMVLKVLQVY
jgi:hypothetical protein